MSRLLFALLALGSGCAGSDQDKGLLSDPLIEYALSMDFDDGSSLATTCYNVEAYQRDAFGPPTECSASMSLEVIKCEDDVFAFVTVAAGEVGMSSVASSEVVEFPALNEPIPSGDKELWSGVVTVDEWTDSRRKFTLTAGQVFRVSDLSYVDFPDGTLVIEGDFQPSSQALDTYPSDRWTDVSTGNVLCE